MNNRFAKGVFVLLFVMLVVLIGCGKDNRSVNSGAGANTSNTNPPSAKSADKKPKDQPLQDLTVATIGDAAVSGPIYYALDKDVFGKYGLKVKRVSLDPSAAVAAVISGDVQIVAGGGPGIVDAAVKTNKVKVIGSHGQIVMWLYAKNISKLEELKGKTIGVTKPGSATDYVGRTLIELMGMQQGNDVKILYTGSAGATSALMSEDKIEAGILTPPETIQAEKMGFKKIANLNEVKGVLGVYGVMSVNNPFATENPQAIENYMNAFSEASKLMKTDKEGTKAAIGKYMKVTDEKVLEELYEIHKNLFPTDLHIPESEVQFILNVLSEKNPAAKTKKPADVMNNRYADAVK